MRRNKELGRFLIPTWGDMIFAAILVGAFLLGPQMMNIDGDLGRHLTIGDHILKTRSIPTEDIFSHTKTGDALTPHEWLSQVWFALAERIAGFDGVVWLTSLVIALSFWKIYKRGQHETGWILIPAFFTLWGAATSSLHWLTRPHIFTFLFVALWMEFMKKLRERMGRWWLMPLLMLIWVNTHGAFIAGFVVWLMYLLGMILDNELTTWSDFRPWIFGGALSLFVTGINPVGYAIWETSIGFLGNKYLVGHTAEYLPPDFQHPSTWPFLGMIMASLILLGINKHKTRFSELFVMAGWTGMALISARNIPLYAVVAIPILADQLVQIVRDGQNWKIFRGWTHLEERFTGVERKINPGPWKIYGLTVLGLLFAIAADAGYVKINNSFSKQVFPKESVQWIKENTPSGKMFNYFPWGGYMLYQTWPEYQVFIDGQTDFYGEELTREYECVITLCPEWEIILEQYFVKWVIIPASSPLADRLQIHQSWNLAFAGDPGWVFVKE